MDDKELIEALQEKLHVENEDPQRDDVPQEGERISGEPAVNHAPVEPTNPEIYADTDPSLTEPDIQPGDPGTYAGEYEPVYDTNIKEVEERDDLPEGFEPGSYAGEYRPA